MSMAPKRLSVPPKTSSPTPLSIGSDSPVITDWSTEVAPLIITPSIGMVSPGSTLNMSSILTSASGIISSTPPLTLRPCCGASLMRFSSPTFARSVVMSSRTSPSAMMKATSPAAKTSPIRSAAISAVEISRGEEILAIPSRSSRRSTASWRIGRPLMSTESQAGSIGTSSSRVERVKLKRIITPLRAVILGLSSLSQISSNITITFALSRSELAYMLLNNLFENIIGK